MSEYPEHEKMAKVKDQSQAIGEFLEFGLPAQGLHLYTVEEIEGDPFRGVQEFPAHKSIEQILADHFEIDLDKIEAEKREMLEKLRAANG